MNKSYLRRSIVAVGLAVATLMTMANPAGAAVHDGTITGGTLVSTKTGAPSETFSLAPTTPSCSSSALSADFGTETLGSTFMVTAFSSSHDVIFTSGTYHVVLTRSTIGNVSGTWTSGSSTTSHFVGGARVGIVIEIYDRTAACTPSNILCRAAVQLNLASTFPTSLGVSGTFSATGSSQGVIVAFTTCGAGPSQILGMNVAITSPITGHITT